MIRLIIFGERPGPNTDPTRPLFPHTTTGAAANLMRLLGMTQEEYLNYDRVVRYNVVEDPFMATSNSNARRRVVDRMNFHKEWDADPKFLFLGRAAAEGAPLGYRTLKWGEASGDVMVIPHPSGRNRYYNSEANKSFIIQSLRDFLGRSSG